MAEADSMVHLLRRRWKPHKERLQAQATDHPTIIRFHRCCSWLQRLDGIEDGQDRDLVLTCQWIAFNALYGQWDAQRREPCPDVASWRRFLDHVLELDRDGVMAEVLNHEKRLVLAILDDAYLGSYFWRDPSVQRATLTQRDRRDALTWYLEKRWGLILEHVVDRIYLLRCQLVHGASTYNSQLNRKSLNRCIAMLNHLLPAMLTVWIDHGADEDWGPMCYPPQG